MFTGIQPDQVLLVWEKVLPLLKKAMKHDEGRYAEDHILSRLLEGKCQLWVGFEKSHVELFVITKIEDFHRKKALIILYLGGKNLYKWMPEIGTIAKWGSKNKCDYIECCGRRGLKKYLKTYGFKEKHICYEVPICQVQNHTAT